MAFIVGIPIFLYFISYKSKELQNLIAYITLILMGFLFIYQNNNSGLLTDFDAYSSLWSYISGGGWGPRSFGYESDWGFMVLMKAVSIFTSKIEFFLLTIYMMSLIFFMMGIIRITPGLNNGWRILPCVYIIFPFIYDLTQIRFILAYSLVFFGISFIIKKDSSSKLLFFLCIIIAGMIHTSSFVYLVLLLFINERISQKIKVILPILSILFFMFRSKIAQIALLSNLLQGKERYLLINKDVSMGSSLFYSISILYYVFVTNYILTEFNKKEIKIIDLKIEVVKSINVFFIVLIPFLFQTLDVERLFRPIYIIDWLIIFGSLNYFKSGLIKCTIVIPLLIIQSIHFIRLDSFILEMISNAFDNFLGNF